VLEDLLGLGLDVLANYAQKLKDVNCRLYLSGMSELAYQQLRGAVKLRQASHVRAYDATPIRGQLMRGAIAHAQGWLVSPSEGSASNDGSSGKAIHEGRS
jgi:hypothetical protein